MGKLAIEGFGLREPDPTMSSGTLKCVFHRLQKAGVIEYWITISNVLVLNHAVAYHFRRGRNEGEGSGQSAISLRLCERQLRGNAKSDLTLASGLQLQ